MLADNLIFFSIFDFYHGALLMFERAPSLKKHGVEDRNNSKDALLVESESHRYKNLHVVGIENKECPGWSR